MLKKYKRSRSILFFSIALKNLCLSNGRTKSNGLLLVLEPDEGGEPDVKGSCTEVVELAVL
jgi:hypothetical protein